jgi:ankyrin repeat protein
LVLSSDDIENLRELSSVPDFDVSFRLAKSLVNSWSFLNGRPTILQISAFFGSVDCFNYLLRIGSDPKLTDLSRNRRSLAEFAVVGGNLEILGACGRFGISMDGCHFHAVSDHRNEVFFWLVERETFPIGQEDKNVPTLMDRAAASNNLEIVKYLYEMGSKARLKLSDGYQSTFAIACQFDCLSIINAILANEAVPRDVVEDGFRSAVAGDSKDVVQFLQQRFEYLQQS